MSGVGAAIADAVGQVSRRLLPRRITIVSVGLVLLGWQLLASQFAPYDFPGVGLLVANVSLVMSAETAFPPLRTYGMTLARVGVGFGLSMVLALVWGAAMGVRRELAAYLAGPLFVFLTVPSVVWAFLGVVWFGLAEFLVPVFVIVAIVFPYLVVTIWKGLQAVDDRLVAMARAAGASSTTIWRDVYLPQLQPYMFGAARVGIAVSWKVALVAEVFGAASGVGVVAKFHFEAFDMGMVIAWALPVMVFVFGVDRALARLERRTRRWQPTDQTPMEVIG